MSSPRAGSVSAGGPPACGAALGAAGGAVGLHQSSPVGESLSQPRAISGARAVTLTRSNVARVGAGEVLQSGHHRGRVGGGDRWAGEGRAGAASPALGGRRVRNKACGVPDSVLLCARSLSHFTRARGPGCNLSRTLILHIPLLGDRRGRRTKGIRSVFHREGSLRGHWKGRRRAIETILLPNPVGPRQSWEWTQGTGSQLRSLELSERFLKLRERVSE
jgi:hypothetical protein